MEMMGLTCHSHAKSTWRPWTLRSSYLSGILMICLLFCVAIELIIRGCSPDGCHVFGQPSATGLSDESYFVYNLLPTILTVIFSLLWAVAYHDFLRLEPYFAMSTEEGALARDSILLDYPYTTSIFIPFISGKRRHYNVFLSSCIQMLVTFVIIPLVSGIFSDANLVLHESISAHRVSLKSMNQTQPVYSNDFTFNTYDYLWLNESLPPFTTPTYALLPLKPSDSSIIVDNETWVAETTMLSAELDCTAARSFMNPSDLKPPAGGPSVVLGGPDPGRHNCVVSLGADSCHIVSCGSNDRTRSGSYSKYYYLQFSTMALKSNWGSHAHAVGPDEYLYMLASNPRFNGTTLKAEDITGIYCNASYYSQSVVANITMPSGRVNSVTPVGPSSTIVGVQGLQNVLNEGADESADPDSVVNTLGYRKHLVPYISTQLRRQMNIRETSEYKYNNSNYLNSLDLSGMEQGTNHLSIQTSALFNETLETLNHLMDPRDLIEAYQRAFKLLFAVAASVELLDPETLSEPVPVRREMRVKGATVNTLSARGSQIGFALLSIIISVLAVLTRKRECELGGEPNSLASALNLLRESPAMCTLMRNAEFMSDRELNMALDGEAIRYKLVHLQGQEAMIVPISSTGKNKSELKEQGQPWRAQQLWMFKHRTGMALISSFALVGGLLVGTFIISTSRNGLPPGGSTDSFSYKVLYSYIPLVVGMSVEPILITIGSCYCMLGPYRTLPHSNILTKASLSVDYDKSPPHFQVIRALRSGEFSLGALSTTIILANVVTVAISGLFSVGGLAFPSEGPLNLSRIPMVGESVDDAERDMYNLLNRHLTAGSGLPSWTSKDFYVFPFYPQDNLSSTITSYQGPAFALGSNISCTNEPVSTRIRSGINVTFYQTFEINSIIQHPCANTTEMFYMPDETFDGVYFSEFCPRVFFPFWLQSDAASDVHGTALKCEAVEIAYELTATVSNTYHILSTADVRTLDADRTAAIYPEGPGNIVAGNLTYDFILSLGDRNADSSTLTTSITWFNFLMTTLHPAVLRTSGTMTFLPDPVALPSAFEDVFRQLFAIKLRLNDYVFVNNDTYPGTGEFQNLRERIVVNPAMALLTGAVMLYTVVVLTLVFFWRKPRVRGHLPASLAAMYAPLYATVQKWKFDGHSKETFSITQEIYAYSWFQGVNREWHYGICRQSEAVEKRELYEEMGSEGESKESAVTVRESHVYDTDEESSGAEDYTRDNFIGQVSMGLAERLPLQSRSS